MAKVTALGQPANEIERDAIAYLKGHLPEAFEIFHTLEIKQNQELFEIDVVILAPQCVFVVDVKGTRGRIDVYGSKWHPENRQPYFSPVAKLRQHAKVLSSLICDTNRANLDLGRVHVQAVTLLTADDVVLVDHGGKDESHVTYCNQKGVAYFKSHSFIPDRRLQDIRPLLPIVRRAIQGKAQPRSTPPRYGDWQVEEKLGSSDRYTEYRAKKILIDGLTVRLRVYQVDPYQDKAERDAELKRISNAFQAVLKIPSHPNILGVRDFFVSDDGDYVALVIEDIPGQALRQHIRKQTLSLEQKLGIMREVLIALDHAHKHNVIHRHLTPDNILVGADGLVRLMGFDYARIDNRTSTIAHEIVDDLEEDARYQAIECYRNPAQARPTSDLFAAGLVFYELLTGQPAFQSAEDIFDHNAIFPAPPSVLQPEISIGLDRWLQTLCAFSAQDRYASADDALKELAALATLQTLDLTNLPTDSPIDNRYRVLERLGKPGNFAVAYKVFDTLGEVVRVLKLVTRDRRSLYERVKQEYKTLVNLPKHPHIVEVVSAGHLKDETPFIEFEYIKGHDLEYVLRNQALTLEQAVQVAEQTAQGLMHLHHHGVYHQDIKPSNLLLTDRGIRIIDFNVATSDRDESQTAGGTRRYVPPDQKLNAELTPADKIDRDLYALGITVYECVTQQIPFEGDRPPIGLPCTDPREIAGCETISDELAQVMMKAIAPKRVDRFASAEAFLTALMAVTSPHAAPTTDVEPEVPSLQTAIEETPTVPESAEVVSPQTAAIAPVVYPVESPTVAVAAEGSTPSLFTAESPPVDPLDRPEFRSGKWVILDPTGLYQPPAHAILVNTEAKWMQSFFTADGLYWVTGRAANAKRLCDWAREWLRIWNKLDAIVEEKQHPRLYLETLFDAVLIPPQWTDSQILQLVGKLDRYPQDNAIAYLLADELGDRDVWLGSPSLDHLAHWLAIQVPAEYAPLERVWQQQMGDRNPELATYYDQQKEILLRQWLGLIEPQIPQLGKFPHAVPSGLQAEFQAYWQTQILRSDGEVLDQLIPLQQSGMAEIAASAHTLLKNRPAWITAERKAKLSTYLNPQARQQLDRLQSPTQPAPLPLDADVETALRWATEQYLPFRRWETTVAATVAHSPALAASFEDWLLKHYPRLKLEPTHASPLNYSVAALVQDLCRHQPVFWVVVDGLGWLDHQELLSILTQQQLSIVTPLQPRLSILPTKTEYAKWSLYAQLLPNDPAWKSDAGKGFAKLGLGVRYTDSKRDRLYQDLRRNAHSLYCWDTDRFDDLYHTEKDWQNLYQVQRPSVLEAIARDIQYCVQQHPHPEQLKVVIASDHGQMMGQVEYLSCPEGFKAKGRMAIGRVDDPRFVILEAEQFGLPEDISVVRGTGCLNSFSYTENREIIGSHGGLYPEEVVVGVSVLSQAVNRLPVQIICRGEGKPQQTGELEITIDNPNSVPLTQLCLYVEQLPSLRTGKSLPEQVAAQQQITIKIAITYPELPPLHEGNQLVLSGHLQFQFADIESGLAALDSSSALSVNQMFSSGFDIDEFF